MTFEEDYFALKPGTYDSEAIELAQSFVNDPCKAPEQRAQAADYLGRVGV